MMLMMIIIIAEKTSKEFKSIQLKNNSLVIDFATETDEGYYMCQASNGIGTGLKKIIHINVNGEYIYTIMLYHKYKQPKINFFFFLVSFGLFFLFFLLLLNSVCVYNKIL